MTNAMSATANAAEVLALRQRVAELTRQVEWFRRQIFGVKSERFAPQLDPQQMHLAQAFGTGAITEDPSDHKHVPAHTRRKPRRDLRSDGADTISEQFFDESKVPVVTITLANPEVQGLKPDEYEVIGEKATHRLAQRPGSYVVLKYVRPVVKLRGSRTLHCPAAPAGVIDGGRADVSLLAGLMLDKFAWHLPLYRQHQRLIAAGFKLSRQWLTQLVSQAAQLLEPIYEAQLASIRASRVKTMDETPIKAGRAGPGKMRVGYFWPIHGELDEVCFPFFESRRHEHVRQVLGDTLVENTVLLSDGYEAYARFATKARITHAQCWAHTRRAFFEAQGAEPEIAMQALRQIRQLYEIERTIRREGLTGEDKRQHRLQHSQPLVDAFFRWIDQQFERQGLLPSNPLTKALAYTRDRCGALQVFVHDPGVPLDTNHLERALRVIPMGKKNWLFCWSEVGAEHAGIVHSLIVTCRLHGIDPYVYLVDVLQRVGVHPASRVDELTPRRWKQLFGDAPLRSDLDQAAAWH